MSNPSPVFNAVFVFQFEDEIIAKLDTLIEEGWGDEHYKDLFYTIMRELCQKHATMRDQVSLLGKGSLQPLSSYVIGDNSFNTFH